jgi:acetyltransferase-like isoleucine patch superfamily enzyme
MSRLADSLAWRLAPGFLGKIARHAVRRYPYVWGDASRLSVAPDVLLNDALLNCASGTITIARGVVIGHGVSLLTGTHDHRLFGSARQRTVPDAGRDIVIGEGAWLASNATLLGPCRVGEHAVVAAGAMVVHDVPPYSVAGGIPAHVFYELERP